MIVIYLIDNPKVPYKIIQDELVVDLQSKGGGVITIFHNHENSDKTLIPWHRVEKVEVIE